MSDVKKPLVIIFVFAFVILIILCASLIIKRKERSPKKGSETISSYQECVAAGYPVREIYPPQCVTPDGKTFIGQ